MQNSQRVSRPHNIGRARLRGVEGRLRDTVLAIVGVGGSHVYERAANRARFAFETGNDWTHATRHRFDGRHALDSDRVRAHSGFS